MASPADSVKEVAAAAAASASEASVEAKEKETRKGGGILWRIWRALSGGRGEDYETRLQYLSKEEAAVHARMRRRMQFSRRSVRNLIVLSVLGEVGAVVYAIITPKSEDLEWQMRAIRVLPMLDLPALSSMIYSILLSFTRMCKYLRTLLRIYHVYSVLLSCLVINTMRVFMFLSAVAMKSTLTDNAEYWSLVTQSNFFRCIIFVCCLII